MKRAVRIIIPICITLAILFCMAWYLLIYDRDFTRDVLLSSARFFENQGNHAISVWLYDLAYNQAEHNDDVAIELAQQYIDTGNYSRAEYTLSNAIADGGGIDLYVALCRIYVEQDKLLDAVNFLNKVSDPAIKAQLSQMRPAAPTVSPEPGIYNQYFSVTVNAELGTLYVTTDREYPSLEEDRYTGPIALNAGENTLFALAVAPNGLVSELAIYGYTLGGVIEEVQFKDAAVEAQIRQQLGVAADMVLFTNQLWDIKEFTVPAEAKDYSDLKYLTYLERLTISNGAANQLGLLASLSNLTSLQITDTAVNTQELATIGNLPKLKKLTLSGCGITTIAGLSGATGLTELDLSNNTVRDLTALTGMQSLQILSLQRNALNNLSLLSTLTSLTELDISYNAVSDLAPLTSLSALTRLEAGSNTIAALPQMENWKQLVYLGLSSNQLTDISAAAICTELVYLNISTNTITDITSLSSLVKLQELHFAYNKVTALPKFPANCALVTIDGSNNQLTSLDRLSGLKALNNVFMDYNAKVSSVKALAKCPVLIQVHVFGTKVKDVKDLTDQSIIVRYDPT